MLRRTLLPAILVPAFACSHPSGNAAVAPVPDTVVVPASPPSSAPASSGLASGPDKQEAARIQESGSTNSAAIEVVVYTDGSAERTSSANKPIHGAPKSYPAGSAEVSAFLGDLSAVGDLASIPTAGCAKSASFGTTTRISASGKTSGDLQCLSGTAPDAARKLFHDAQVLEGRTP